MKISAQQKQNVLFSFLLLTVMVFSTFYTQLSPGGEGLLIPYNAIVWISAVILICAGVFQVILTSTIILPSYWLGMAALPLAIILSGFIIESSRPVEWLIRIGYVIGGYLFFIALFQFKLKHRTIENILLGLCASAILHSFITYSQISGWSLAGLIPKTASNAPISIFQQINVNASYLTTCFFIALYLASSNGIKQRSQLFKALLVTTIFATTAMLLAISSRTTLVAFCVSLPLIIYARYTNFLNTKKLSLLLVAAFILGIGWGANLSHGFAKYETKLDVQRQHARTYIYDLSWQIFQEKPLLGHGLGKFEEVFQEAKVSYANSDKMGAQKFSHPHNELLFWMIQSGGIAIAGIMIAMLVTFKLLFRLNRQQSISYIALLFPISFHTQVELPFYLSSALWFVWLMILFLIHRHLTTSVNINFSRAMNRLISTSSIVSCFIITCFLLHSLIALAGMTQFIRTKPLNFSHLQAAQHNMYLQDISQNLTLTNYLYYDIATGNTKLATLFVEWAQSTIKQNPATDLMANLTLAYWYLGDKEQARLLITKAHKMYPKTQTIQDRYQDIINNRPIEQFTQKIKTFVEHTPSQAKATNNHK